MTNITNNEIVTSFTGLQSIYIYTQIQPPPNNVTVLWTSSTGIWSSWMEKRTPNCINPRQDGGLRDRGTQVVGVFGGAVLWMFVQQRENHRLNLIHTRRSSVSGLLNDWPLWEEWQCLTSRGGCVTVGSQAQQQEPFYTRLQTLASDWSWIWAAFKPNTGTLSCNRNTEFPRWATLYWHGVCLQWQVEKLMCLLFPKLKLFRAFVQ